MILDRSQLRNNLKLCDEKHWELNRLQHFNCSWNREFEYELSTDERHLSLSSVRTRYDPDLGVCTVLKFALVLSTAAHCAMFSVHFTVLLLFVRQLRKYWIEN